MKGMIKWMLVWSSYFLLIWLGTAGSILSFGSALSITADYLAVLRGCAVVAAVMAALYRIPKKGIRRILIGASAMILVFLLYTVRRDLIRGAAYVGSMTSIEYAKEIDGIATFIPVEPLPKRQIQEVITLFFMGAGALLAWALAWAVARERRSYLGVLLTLPLLAVILVITRQPNWAGILCLFPFWTALILSGKRQGNDESDRAKMTLLTLPVSAALLAVLFFHVGESTYSRPESVDRLRSQVMGWLTDDAGDGRISLGVGRVSHGIGGSTLDEIDLQGRGDLRFTGEIRLEVFSEHPDQLYLHERSGAKYTGSAWTAFEMESYAGMDFSMFPMNISPQCRGWYPTNSLVINPRLLDKNSILTPYNFCVEDGPALIPVRDLLYQSRDEGPYSFTYKMVGEEALYHTDVEMEESFEAYDQFVEMQYRQVPETLQAKLSSLLESEALERTESKQDLIDGVVSLLSSYQYTLTPGTTPEGEDFVEYFLFQNKQGYCVHFASAATLLLRTLGIPARYAEGYVVTKGDFGSNGWAQVKDWESHAWVEVYYRGLGWQPLEVTPGGMTAQQRPEVGSSRPEESLEKSVPPEEISANRSESKTSESSWQSEAETTKPSSGENPMFWLLWTCLVLSVCGIWIVLRRHWRIAMRRREFDTGERNQAVLSMYRYLEQLRPYGAAVSNEIKRLALKAQYSQQGVTEEEAQTVRQYTKEQTNFVCQGLSFWRRFIFRYVRALG